MSDSLWPHGMQHTGLPCPSLSPRICLNSCPLSCWCHPTISSSVSPFSSCPQPFPASGSFSISWLFTSGGQSMGASASAAFLPVNIQGWFLLVLTGLISLQSKGLSRVFSNTTAPKHQFFSAQPSLWSISHIHVWASHFNSLLEEGIKQALGTFRKSLHCTNAETPPNPPQQFHSCIKAWIAPW